MWGQEVLVYFLIVHLCVPNHFSVSELYCFLDLLKTQKTKENSLFSMSLDGLILDKLRVFCV